MKIHKKSEIFATKISHSIALTSLLFSLILVIWVDWPIKANDQILNIDIENVMKDYYQTNSKDQLAETTGNLANNEYLSIILNWKPTINYGDKARISIRIEKIRKVTENINDSVLRIHPGNNISKNFDLSTLVKIDMKGVEINPGTSFGQTLKDDEIVKFSWIVKPKTTGQINGVVWSYLQFFPIDESEMFETAISAQSLQIKVRSIFGIKSFYWRLFYASGFLCSLIIERKTLFKIFQGEQLKRIKN